MKSQIQRTPQGAAPQTNAPGAQPAPTLRYGDHFGKYVINGFAGRGATSFVYQARPREGFERVAVKVLHPHLIQDPNKRRQFYQEARIMMRMRHPNVVRFYEILEQDGHLAYVMEYIDGLTLEDWMKVHARQANQMELACLFSDILRGLSHAHRHGVVHRDVKPANVLITEDNGRLVAKIIDFGLARFADEPLSAEERQKIAGTAAYISPEEVVDPDSVCEASDLYSLGVILYEAACGKRPFEAETPRELLDAHARMTPKNPRELNPTLSPQFEEVILRTLSKRPETRFDSAPAMIQALQDAIQAAMRHEMQQAALENAATTEWQREDPRQQAQQRHTAMMLYLMMCMRAMFSVLAAPVQKNTAKPADRDALYINRPPDPNFHLPLG